MRGGLRWEDVDCGVLLSGPTGVGKTMFAGALARTCGCPLVSASLGEWQAAGHLGDLLKAMRRTFDEARKCAPCILFFYEIDRRLEERLVGKGFDSTVISRLLMVN